MSFFDIVAQLGDSMVNSIVIFLLTIPKIPRKSIIKTTTYKIILIIAVFFDLFSLFAIVDSSYFVSM